MNNVRIYGLTDSDIYLNKLNYHLRRIGNSNYNHLNLYDHFSTFPVELYSMPVELRYVSTPELNE